MGTEIAGLQNLVVAHQSAPALDRLRNAKDAVKARIDKEHEGCSVNLAKK